MFKDTISDLMFQLTSFAAVLFYSGSHYIAQADLKHSTLLSSGF